jgi:hypothetical protein
VPEFENKVQELASLLRDIGATPRFSNDRVVRSTLYDLDYHVAIIACAFSINAIRRTDNTMRIVSHWLKLLQFIAARPRLLADFHRWAHNRRQPTVDSWQTMPRGFLGDRTHDRVIDLLVAGGVLFRTAEEIVSGERFAVLENLHERIVSREILLSERATLTELARTAVNKTMLRGA